MNFQMFKLDLQKAEEPEIKLPTSVGSLKKQEFQKNIYFCFIDYAKDLVDQKKKKKLWKILKGNWGIQDGNWEFQTTLPGITRYSQGNTSLPYLPPEKSMRVKKQQLELDMEQQTGSKLGKEYIKAVYCHPAYLTYMQSTSLRNAGLDEAQAGIKIAGGNINNLRYADDTTLMAESEEELKILSMKVKRSENVGLKLNIQKMKIMASRPITSWQIDGKTTETVTDFIF